MTDAHSRGAGILPAARRRWRPLTKGTMASPALRLPTPRPSVWRVLVLLALLLPLLAPAAFGVERFPPPDFTDHEVPRLVPPAPEVRGVGWVDVLVLSLGLAAATWFSLKSRSRRGIVVLSILSLLYFGFWRRGCVCAIGSVQNVALGLAEPSYAVPLAVVALFTLPLVVALVWGRSFCSGVCPHGALQDLVLVKPVKVPTWLDEVLRVVPWLHLALGVLLAATGGMFLICKYDPFVGVFRMAGPRVMLISGVALLALSMFVGRPYCRYLCPYGALLGVASRFARWRPAVTPGICTQCRLCETSCPFGALNPPQPQTSGRERLAATRRRTVLLALALPILALGFMWLGGRAALLALPLHPSAKLAALVVAEERGELSAPLPDEVAAFHRHGSDQAQVSARAAAVERRFLILGRIMGGFFGLVMALKLARIFFPEPNPDYATDDGRCVSCARCFSACPYELQRRGIVAPANGKGGCHDGAAV
jgi:ferredoxin